MRLRDLVAIDRAARIMNEANFCTVLSYQTKFELWLRDGFFVAHSMVKTETGRQ
jgi:hypothetical protein